MKHCSFVVMNALDKIINNISVEIVNVAEAVKESLIESEKSKNELKKSSFKYDEDDFTNYINGHQYAIDDLMQALKCLSGAQMQCRFIEKDKQSIEQKYGRMN